MRRVHRRFAAALGALRKAVQALRAEIEELRKRFQPHERLLSLSAFARHLAMRRCFRAQSATDGTDTVTRLVCSARSPLSRR